MIGLQGPPGDRGAQGMMGEAGDSRDGPNGTKGEDGLKGRKGVVFIFVYPLAVNKKYPHTPNQCQWKFVQEGGLTTMCILNLRKVFGSYKKSHHC